MRVASVEGSAPRDAGTTMTVMRDRVVGTIGGGRLEYDAIASARALLQSGAVRDTQTISLGPDMGQCCGGKVVLEFQDAAHAVARNEIAMPPVYIFGGGHVGRAITQAMAPLPVALHLVESRDDYLTELPSGAEGIALAAPEAAVRSAPKDAAFIVVTHDHGLDFLIVQEALERGDAAYVGMIGSKTKRAVLEKRLRGFGIDPGPLMCPIGAAGLGDKRPEVIAAFVVAEVLSAFKETS